MMIKVRLDPALYPFRSRWFDSSHGRVHYLDEGTGPPLLLCHGAPTWSFLCRHVITRLRHHFRCIAPDLLGFGLSERPSGYGYTVGEQTAVLGELVDHLALRDILVLGHDWGGPIGVGAALPRAERVRGLILTNTVFWPVDALPNRLFSIVMSTGPLRRRILERNLLIERMLLPGLRGRITPGEAELYRAVQPTTEARVALAAMPGEIRSARPSLARLAADVPRTFGDAAVLVPWGMRDPVFPGRTCLPRIRAMLPQSSIVGLSTAGHLPQEDAPAEMAEAIMRHFG